MTEQRLADQEDRNSGAQRQSLLVRHYVERVCRQLFECARGDDDAEQDQPEAIPERVDRKARALARGRRFHRVLGPLRIHAEVRPPQTGAESEAEDRGDNELKVDRQTGGADPDGDHRLTDRDDQDESVTLDEVPRVDHESGIVDQLRRDPLDQER